MNSHRTTRPRTGGMVSTEQRGATRWVRLNRPDRLNALTPGLLAEFDGEIDAAMSDPATAVVVVAGTGTSFCAGADLTHLLEVVRSGAEPFEFLAEVSASFTRIEHAPKPVIGALHGHVVGGGLELALVCDVVLACTGTLIGDGHIRNGLLPAAGSSVRLPRKVGEPLARRLMQTGELLPAEELVSCGFVSEVVDEACFEDAVDRFAGAVGSAGTAGARARMKELLVDHAPAGGGPPVDRALARELEVFAEHWREADIGAALTAFATRRSSP